MASVFVSYRRSDSPGHAGRLYDNLVARLGAENVFMDVGSTELGADFVAAIEDALARVDVVLVVIGPNWLADDRLRDHMDWVRLEIARACERDVRVVPVLVGGASMPSPRDVPRELATVMRRQAVELSDMTWPAQVAGLLDSLQRASERPAPKHVPSLIVSRMRAGYEDAEDSFDEGAIGYAAIQLGLAWQGEGNLAEARAAFQRAADSSDDGVAMQGKIELEMLDKYERDV
jgi:hypothetical protein